jgi:Protein of unknown function (DUF2971)
MPEITMPFEDRFFSQTAVNCNEPIIFHYTGAAGALGILTSAQIWCTLTSHMNDREESRFAHSVAMGIASRELSQADAGLRDRFLEEFSSQLRRIERVKIFAACFSECEDLLSQWRGYSGKLGYALGFSLNNLKKVGAENGFSIAEVKYKHEEHEAELTPIVRSLIVRFDGTLNVDSDRAKIEADFRDGMRAIAEKSAVIKHPAFAEEREWRLHSNPFLPLHDQTDFVVRNDQIVPILKADLEDGTVGSPHFTRNICLRSLIVGPGPDQADRGKAITSVCLRHNIHFVCLFHSATPLR